MKYARTTTVTIPVEKTAEFTRIYEQTILPALKPVPGFQGAYLFNDPATGEGFSLTFWASEKDATAYEQSGLYAELVEKLRPFFTTQPMLKTYQVMAEASSPVTASR
jgi:heme-degrading monooxygenase HmoA